MTVDPTWGPRLRVPTGASHGVFHDVATVLVLVFHRPTYHSAYGGGDRLPHRAISEELLDEHVANHALVHILVDVL